MTDVLEIEDDIFEGITEDRIDREKGIVRGVKLLGVRSKNRRDYETPGVRVSAAKLLPNTAIYIDHPATATTARSYRDKFGAVGSKVEYIPGKGHFGDIHFNPKHAAAEQFVWDVLNAPKTFGMSINSSVKYADNGRRNKNGDQVVESIEVLRTLDVVTRPGTTDGIFEHVEEEEIMDLKTLQEKHPDLVAAIKAQNEQTVTEQAELEAAKAEAATLKAKLDAMESAIAAEKQKVAVSTEFAKIFEGSTIEASLMTEIVECACEMAESSRVKFAGVMSKISPMLVEVPEEEQPELEEPVKEEVEEEVKTPAYRPGPKGKSTAYSLKASLGLK